MAEEVNKQTESIRDTLNDYENILSNQQAFLENVANNARKDNLVITGIKEENKDDEIFTSICSEIAPDGISDESPVTFNCKRLGNDQTHKPRPLLVELTRKKNEVLY